jgi:hypothetical protein
MRLARAGLVAAISPGEKLGWARASKLYREYLSGVAREVKGGRQMGL